MVILVNILQVKVERLRFCKRSSQQRGGFFINPLEQVVIWNFEVAAYLGETGALTVNWVPV